MKPRLLAIPLVVAALAVLSVSAPVVGASGSDFDTVVHSTEALGKAGSAHFAGTVEAGGTTGSVTFTGGFDFKRHNGQFSIDAGALGSAGLKGKLTLLLVDNVAYIKIASLKSLTKGRLPAQLAGKQWLSLDLHAYGGGQSLNQADPSSAVNVLRGVTTVQKVGSATVRGVAATRYHAQIDLAQAVQNTPVDLRPAVQQAIQNLGGSGVIPADVYVDAQGRLRRFGLAITVKSGTTTANVRESFDFFDFGVHVTATAPPASQTFDFTPLLAQLGQQSSAAGSSTPTS